jgi:trans-aconitate 2-methyltransferase
LRGGDQGIDMPSWDPGQYLQFVQERTRPARDLVGRSALESPRRVIDLGCGPGNSSRLLAERWPGAALTGLDSAAAMIAAASRDYPDADWVEGDIAGWATEDGPAYDLVFSNAALQWVADHATVYPGMFGRVAPGGALAIQVPADIDAPAHRAMRDLAASPRWRDAWPAGGVREWRVHDAGFYYDLLCRRAARLDIWQTEYLHILPDAAAIVAWYKGTGLRPFLDALPTDHDRERFEADYLTRIREAYRPRADGRVILPFLRLFLIAWRDA